MALRRRSVFANLASFSGAFQSSISHLHRVVDLHRYRAPRGTFHPPSPHSSPVYAPHPLFRGRNGIMFPPPLGIRSYSYSSETPSGGEFSKDVAEVLGDSSIDAAVLAASVPGPPASFPGEVAAAAADSFPPVWALQHMIDGVHTFTGLNWWASIVLMTVLIRIVTVPLLIKQMKATMKLNMMKPEMEEIKQRLQNSMDPQSVQEGQKKMKALFEKHGVTPFTALKGVLIQGPIFVSFFFAISNMVEKVPSFKGGGALWFTDLTTPDPFYALPTLTGLTFLATVELNMQEGMEGNPNAQMIKNFSRLLAVFTIPFTGNFPQAIFCYWITSNLFSLVYGSVMKHPPVKKFLNIPDLIPSTPASQPIFSFSGRPSIEPTSYLSSSMENVAHAKSAQHNISATPVVNQPSESNQPLETAKKRRKMRKRR